MLPDTTGSQKCKMAADKPEVNTSHLEHGIARLLEVLPELLDEKLQRLHI